ncbi:hypothetical protein INR49_016255, partial [Caranx melampygus]
VLQYKAPLQLRGSVLVSDCSSQETPETNLQKVRSQEKRGNGRQPALCYIHHLKPNISLLKNEQSISLISWGEFSSCSAPDTRRHVTRLRLDPVVAKRPQ